MKANSEANSSMDGSEIFTSSVRSAADLAGVFEYDGETGYFYLYDQRREESQKILDTIHIISARPDFDESDLQIVWDKTETYVALVIRGRVWAAFDTRTNAKYGGDYRPNQVPSVPTEIVRAFSQTP